MARSPERLQRRQRRTPAARNSEQLPHRVALAHAAELAARLSDVSPAARPMQCSSRRTLRERPEVGALRGSSQLGQSVCLLRHVGRRAGGNEERGERRRPLSLHNRRAETAAPRGTFRWRGTTERAASELS